MDDYIDDPVTEPVNEEPQQEVQEEVQEQKIYLGPNIPNLGMLRNQVYLGGLPGQVRAAIVVMPELEVLIVPITKLTETAKAVQTKGTHEHHVYQEILRKAGKA